MKVVFVSNYFNHHQKPFSNAMYNLLGDNYHFIETEQMEKERKNMGWGIDEFPSYVISYNEFIKNNNKCQELINDADVVIFGSAPFKLLKQRKKQNKLIFRYSERPLKKGLQPIKFIPRCIKWNIQNPKNKPIYMLCASAYTASDYKKFGLFKGKTFKWGYFPKVKVYDDIGNLIKNKEKNSIIWVARFIDLKHPEIAIKLAERLKREGYNFEIKMIGNGQLLPNVLQKTAELGLEDCVKILGAMSPEEVRSHMENSEIHIFTSDRNEGWGAVLNEAMNSACVPVASHAIGSVPFLIEDGVNGLTYKDGDFEDFYSKVKFLLDNPDKRQEIGENAYQAMINEWNAENAAKKFLYLAESFFEKGKVETKFEKGVCSKAKILKDDWYNGYIIC